MKKKPLTNKAGKVRKLTFEDFHSMKSAREVLPVELLDVLPNYKVGQRGQRQAPKK